MRALVVVRREFVGRGAHNWTSCSRASRYECFDERTRYILEEKFERRTLWQIDIAPKSMISIEILINIEFQFEHVEGGTDLMGIE